MKQRNFPQGYKEDTLQEKKHGGNRISNFHFLSMLNSVFSNKGLGKTVCKQLAKILAKILANILPSLIVHEKTCAVKSRTIQDNIPLVYTIIKNLTIKPH